MHLRWVAVQWSFQSGQVNGYSASAVGILQHVLGEGSVQGCAIILAGIQMSESCWTSVHRNGVHMSLCAPAAAAAKRSVGVSWQGFPPLLLHAILKWRFLQPIGTAKQANTKRHSLKPADLCALGRAAPRHISPFLSQISSTQCPRTRFAPGGSNQAMCMPRIQTRNPSALCIAWGAALQHGRRLHIIAARSSPAVHSQIHKTGVAAVAVLASVRLQHPELNSLHQHPASVTCRHL